MVRPGKLRDQSSNCCDLLASSLFEEKGPQSLPNTPSTLHSRYCRSLLETSLRGHNNRTAEHNFFAPVAPGASHSPAAEKCPASAPATAGHNLLVPGSGLHRAPVCGLGCTGRRRRRRFPKPLLIASPSESHCLGASDHPQGCKGLQEVEHLAQPVSADLHNMTRVGLLYYRRDPYVY